MDRSGARVNLTDALRVVALAAQAEMALVRRDGVCGPLLAQAARAAAGTPAEPVLAEASRLVRTAPEREAVRQAALSLTRMGLHEVEASVLESAGRA